MSHFNLIKHNRVFLEPGNSNPVTTTLTSDYSSIISENTPIQVSDTNNLSSSGFVIINNEVIYYGSKTVTTLQNIKRAMNNTSAGDHSSGDTVSQTKSAINDNNTIDNQLSGWYIDGKTNQASLRVFNSPVILPGVIRLKQNSDNSYKFQGCTDYSSSTPTWVDFNATQGDKGDTGDINTILRFSNVGTSSTSGDIIKTTNLTINNNSSDPTQIEVRGIAPGSTIVNNETVNTLQVETTTNDVTLTSKPLPYTWNLARPLSDLKNTTDDTLNSFGKVVSMYVVPGKTVLKGQVLTTNTFTSGSNTYLGVEPLTYTTITDLDGYSANPTNQLSGIIGLAKQDGDASLLSDIEVSNVKVSIITNGIGMIKIDNTSANDSISVTPDVNITGRPCLLGTGGFGFHPSSEPTATHYKVGNFVEKGATLATNDNYALIKIDLTYIE